MSDDHRQNRRGRQRADCPRGTGLGALHHEIQGEDGQRQRERLVAELGAPVQEVGIGGIEESGEAGHPRGRGRALDEQEDGEHQDEAGRADDEDRRGGHR